MKTFKFILKAIMLEIAAVLTIASGIGLAVYMFAMVK